MNFTEACNHVSDIVARPDLIVQIRREVNAAINFFSVEGDFAYDYDETSVAIDPSVYVQSVPLSSLTRFRKVVYIRPSNRGKMLTSINPAKAFVEGKQRCDAFYIAGSSIVVNLSKQAPQLLIGYKQYPPVLTDANGSHWMLDMLPWMVINKAAAVIFRHIGNNDEAQTHEGLAQLAFVSAVQDMKRGVQY